METVVSLLSPAAWELVRQDNIIKKDVGSPQTITPTHFWRSICSEIQVTEDMAEVITKKGLRLDFLVLFHLTFPLADLPTHALEHGILQKKMCLQDCELNEKQAFSNLVMNQLS